MRTSSFVTIRRLRAGAAVGRAVGAAAAQPGSRSMAQWAGRCEAAPTTFARAVRQAKQAVALHAVDLGWTASWATCARDPGIALSHD